MKYRYKVPFRKCYTNDFGDWVLWSLWCHLVIKLFPHAHDFGSNSCLAGYIEDPNYFHEQFKPLLIAAKEGASRHA